jgi:four helix bundle protein
MAFRFESLEVFDLAVEFARLAYQMTRKFPRDEMFGLTANLRRAATSVALNIAEGAGRSSRREFLRFLDIATGSVFETIASFIVADRLGYLEKGALADLREEADRLARKLNSFKRSLSGDQRSAISDQRIRR